jgi:DNA-binding CsgD family transcriptional regulator
MPTHATSHSVPATDNPLIRTTRSGPLVKGLLADWEVATRSPRALRRANSWGLPGGPVAHLDDIVVRAGFGGRPDCDDADAYLLELVRLAATDPLAAQIVLHRVLPPVISIARRRGRRHVGGIEGALGDLVTQAWFVISSYPVERRPRKVAANIVRDIEYFEFVSGHRARRTKVEFVDHDFFVSGDMGAPPTGISTPPEADDVHNFLIDLQAQKVSPLRITIMRMLCDGWQGTDIGRQLGMNERTVRWHKAAALKAVPSWVEEVRPADAKDGEPRCDVAV